MKDQTAPVFREFPSNPRKISRRQFEELGDTLHALGDLSGIIYNRRTKNFPGGNQRSKAISFDDCEIEYVTTFEKPDEQGTVAIGFVIWEGHRYNYREVDWDEPTERHANLVANKGGGDWDFDILAEAWTAEELSDGGFTDVEIGEIFPEEPPTRDTTEGGMPNPEDAAFVKRGDIIEIRKGKKTLHRLMCGDSTLKDDVLQLLDGTKCQAAVTDPPYGVNVQGGKNKSNIAGDLTQTVIPFSFELAVTVATDDQARFYFFGGEGNIPMYHKLFERYLQQMPKICIWVKDNFVLKQLGYHTQYELVFFGYKPGGGGAKHWYAGRTMPEASDVWQYAKDHASTYVHPTQKPVDLICRPILNSTKEGDAVYEPFSGSGSTMIACHETGRRCFAMDIDPQYCSATIRRICNYDPELSVYINGKKWKP